MAPAMPAVSDSTFIDRNSFSCADIGVQQVIFTAIDVNGNQASATADLNVIDSISPLAMAQNISLYLGTNGQAAISPNDINNGFKR
ncbi:MAG: hypothetical protein U5L96_17435 [Owenweeksia sp.]|nr:hypothetical protein [Owenweeksia sp.]